ncbi:MAG: helix-hairpin-helix domain-containing protein [bacterium]|nr:helix-hairpin-helix domain-containing protein [bacterium]
MSISKRNRRGIWVLIILCVTLAYIPRVLAEWSQEGIQVSHETIAIADKKVKEQQQVADSKKKRKYSNKKKAYKSPPTKFDPNEYSREDWMYLGLSEKQADVVLKFTSRGVASNQELEKIFVIPEEVFKLIQDSTYYPKKADKLAKTNRSKIESIIDINTASFEELKTLPGIGDFYAKKIIEQRENLGGFVGKEQLLELWKFGTERYDKIQDRIIVSGGIKKLNVNTADIETLKNHPYISYKVANSIVKMREVHGNYRSLEEIMKSVLINQELFSKIRPYLTF